MPKNIDEIEFTILDTETTGLDPEAGDRIVEIAALKFKEAQRISSFQSLVNPGRAISEAAFSVNQISDEMLKKAPKIAEVMPQFLDFIRGSYLCSYNAPFDLGFLNQELKLLRMPTLENEVVIDIFKMAKRLLPGLERYGLWFVAKTLKIELRQEHRAFADVELAFAVFQKLKTQLGFKGIRDEDNFVSLFGLTSQFLVDITNRKISQIQEAIELGVRIKIKYLSGANSALTEREIIPKEIRQERRQNYLVGYCCLRNEERTFRIDGILHLESV